jgi:hypothetical protein
MKKRGSCSCGTITLFFLLIVAGILFWIAFPVFFAPPPKPEDTKWPLELTLINRAEWGNEEIANPEGIDVMNGVKRITIHHDGMPPLPMKTEGQIKSRIVSIRKAHSKKYADIGYHFIVDPLGRIWEGRPLEYQGAHVQGKNENNIGILFLGNTYHDKPTEKGLDGLFTFLRYLRQRYEISEANVVTHRELAQTGCPGKFLQEEIDKARKAGELKYKKPGDFTFDLEETITRIENLIKKLKGLVEKYSSLEVRGDAASHFLLSSPDSNRKGGIEEEASFINRDKPEFG